MTPGLAELGVLTVLWVVQRVISVPSQSKGEVSNSSTRQSLDIV